MQANFINRNFKQNKTESMECNFNHKKRNEGIAMNGHESPVNKNFKNRTSIIQ